MEFYDYNRISDDVVINTITAKLVEALGKKMEELKEQQDSPFVYGIDGLARYLGIGETVAQEMKNNKEISEDEHAVCEKDVNKIISEAIEKIEKLCADKEKDVLSV